MAEVCPIFMDLTLEDQINELLTFLKQLPRTTSSSVTVPEGTKDEPKAKSKNVQKKSNEENLAEILEVFETIFSEINESDLEFILNNIVSILVTVDIEQTSSHFQEFCDKLLVAAKNYSDFRLVLLRVLWLLFQSIGKSKTFRCTIYGAILDLSLMVDRFHLVFKNVEQFQSLFEYIDDTSIEMRTLYRRLYAILMKRGQNELASKIMTNLLSTYSEETAGEAKNDAVMCILSAIADENNFLLEPLLTLKPVQQLENEPVHDLLRVFVSENYNTYLEFYKKHSNLVTKQWKLDHDKNLRKMRQLTFMQLVESCTEITFETIGRELSLSETEVEQFIIDVVKTKLVKARMDQAAKKVYVTSSMNRTFGLKQWQHLDDLLHTWKQHIDVVNESLKPMIRELDIFDDNTDNLLVF